MRHAFALAWLAAAGWAFPAPGAAAEYAPVRFTLNSLSLISFGDREIVSIPADTLTFRCFPSGAEDALALRLEPGGFGRKSTSLAGRSFSAELARPAKGSLRRVAAGSYAVELEAVFRVTSSGPEGKGTHDITILFTTESIEVWDAKGTQTLNVSGSRLDGASRVIQLVGKTVMGKNDGPVAGAAVYVVLSGVLDRIPPF